MLLVCAKDGIRLQQTDHNQICLVDAQHVATLEGEGFNVAVDTKRLLAILRQAMTNDVAKLCLKDEKILEVVLHSPSRQVSLDVPVRPPIKAMVMAALPDPNFELAVPVQIFKRFLALTRQTGKVMGVAVAGDKKSERIFLVLFDEECRSLWRVGGAAGELVQVDETDMVGFFRQMFHLSIVKTIFKGLAPEQRVVVKLHKEQPLQIVLPSVGGRSTRFVVATVVLKKPERETSERTPAASADTEDPPEPSALEGATK